MISSSPIKKRCVVCNHHFKTTGKNKTCSMGCLNLLLHGLNQETTYIKKFRAGSRIRNNILGNCKLLPNVKSFIKSINYKPTNAILKSEIKTLLIKDHRYKNYLNPHRETLYKLIGGGYDDLC